VINWEDELGDLDLGGLGDDPGTSFLDRLLERPDFCGVAGGLALAWRGLDKRRRDEGLAGLVAIALDAVPEPRTPADARNLTRAIIEAFQRQAGRAFAAGDIPPETLRQLVGARLPRRPQAKPRALPNPISYYTDALTLPLPSWAGKWCPGMNLEDDYAALAERRRRARRTARRHHLDKPYG
jgi:hypothetical protein